MSLAELAACRDVQRIVRIDALGEAVISGAIHRLKLLGEYTSFP